MLDEWMYTQRFRKNILHIRGNNKIISLQRFAPIQDQPIK